MKRRIICLLLAVMLAGSFVPGRAFAADIVDYGYCGGEGDGTNLIWILDTDGALTIRGTGAMNDWVWDSETESTNVPWFGYRNAITSVVIEDGVTGIGNYAFDLCPALTSVSIPDTVTRIGMAALADCDSLPDVTIPASVTSIGAAAFSLSDSLMSLQVDPNSQSYSSADGVLFNKQQSMLIAFPCGRSGAYSIPDSVTFIADFAFYGTDRLTGITVPDSVTLIGEYAFAYCGLTDVWFGGTQAEWDAIQKETGNDALISADFHPESDFAVSGTCGEALTWTLDKDGVLTISGTGAMYDWVWDSATGSANVPWGGYMDRIISVVIEDGVTSIGSFAFDLCPALTAVSIPDTVTWIGAWALAECDNLPDVTIPAGVTGIGVNAFAYCHGLMSFQVDPNNQSYSSVDGVLFDRQQTVLISFPHGRSGEYRIPDSVTGIEAAAFSGSGALTGITLPDGLTGIGAWAFADCGSLTGMTIPAGVTGIEKGTFFGCGRMTGITLPGGLAGIGDQAFYLCNGLNDVWFGGTQAQWDAVSVETSNDPLTSARLHVTPDESGGAQTGPFTVTFNGSGAAVSPAGKTVTNGAVYGDLPKPVLSGYAFAGWFTVDGTQVTADTVVRLTEDQTLYARWDPVGSGVSDVMTPEVGSISSVPGGKTITLTCGTAGAEIYYTTDGSVPTESSALYRGPISLTETATVKAAAKFGSDWSDVFTAPVSVPQVSRPEADPGGGELSSDPPIVTLRCDTPNAEIWYTENPDASFSRTSGVWRKYSRYLIIEKNTTLRAIAVMDGSRDSEIVTCSYTIPGQVEKNVSILLGNTTVAADGTASVPVYLFMDEKMQLSQLELTVAYDKRSYEGEVSFVRSMNGMNGTPLPADGKVEVFYHSDKLLTGGGELGVLHLRPLASLAAGTRLTVSVDSCTVKTASGASLTPKTQNSVITLTEALLLNNTQLAFSASGGSEIDQASDIQSGSKVDAAISIDQEEAKALYDSDPEEFRTVNAALAFYSQSGMMVKVEMWEVDISQVNNLLFTRTIEIPKNVSVGKVKLLILSDDMVPLMLASQL